MSYWDILDFLAEEESITIKFKQLDRSKDFTDRVPAGYPIEVPIWKAVTVQLYSSGLDVMEMKIPKFFYKSGYIEFLNSLTASKKVESINLKKYSDFFYRLLGLLREIIERSVEAADPSMIADIYSCRASGIMNLALKSYSSKDKELNKPGYTYNEIELYNKAFSKTIEYGDWRLNRVKSKNY